MRKKVIISGIDECPPPPGVEIVFSRSVSIEDLNKELDAKDALRELGKPFKDIPLSVDMKIPEG